jgi:hypothetical protein
MYYFISATWTPHEIRPCLLFVASTLKFPASLSRKIPVAALSGEEDATGIVLLYVSTY